MNVERSLETPSPALAQASAEVQQRAQGLETLARVTTVLGRATNRAEVFDLITRSARELLDVKLVHLWIERPRTSELTLAASSSLDDAIATTPIGGALIGRIAESRKSEFIDDILTSERWPDHELAERLELRSFAGVPLLAGDALIGVLSVLGGSARTFDGNDHDLLGIFADQAAIAIERAQLYERLADKTQRLEVLHRLALGMTAAVGEQEAFSAVARSAVELFGDVGCSLWVLDRTTGDLVLVADAGVRYPQLRRGRSMKVGQGLMGSVVAERRPRVLDDIQRAGHNQALSQAEGFRAAMAVPLLFGDQCFGGLSVRRRDTEAFRPEDVDLLTALAGYAAVTIEQARLYDDLTRTNAHLLQQTAELQIKNSELDSFAYAVSHDLKAPLVTLQGMTGLLEEGWGAQLDEQGRHFLTRIAATAQHMERLIGDILVLSRLGREGRGSEAVSLDGVVDGVLAELAEPLRTRGVKVTRAALGTVQAVRSQMEHVFSNLLSNAVKYLGDTPAAPAIEIGQVARGADVAYFVRDNGIGIDPAYHEKIFETFERLKEIDAEGTGVGLAIVKKIVEAGDGTLWVESAPGEGATFFFTWPHLPDASDPGGA
jgi:signal transduction histidine kinase